MASKFGGVQVDQPVSKFGGVSVDQAPQAEGGQFPFEGLTPEIEEGIRTKFPSRARGQSGIDLQRQRAADLERLRLKNPALASQVEETGGLESFLIGAGQGFKTLGRAIGVSEPADESEKQSIDALRTQSPGAFGAGEIVAESAPFLAAAPLTGAGLAASTAGRVLIPAARSLAGRSAGTSALTATEGAAIAKGRGAKGLDVAKAGVVGGVLGPLGGLAAPLTRKLSSIRNVAKQGKELIKEPTKKDIREGLARATPSVEDLREASKSIYKGIDDLGIQLSPDGLSNLSNAVSKSAKDLGFRATSAGKKQSKESAIVIELLEEFEGGSVKLADVEDIRRSAQSAGSVASRAGNNKDAAISGAIVDSIDDFLAKLNTKNITGGGVNIGDELATARQLWGRAKKAELLDLSVDAAALQRSGLENGIRIKFEQILKNKKQRRFFKESELTAMRGVVEGTAGANFFKRLGKTGFGRGQQTNVLSGVATLGVTSSLLGPVTGVLLSTAGQISKVLAENLTKRNADFANKLIRAGDDAEIITRIYLKSTPKAQRNSQDLASLLMRPDVNLELAKSELAREAADIAKRSRLDRSAASATLAAPAAAAQEE